MYISLDAATPTRNTKHVKIRAIHTHAAIQHWVDYITFIALMNTPLINIFL